MPEQRKVQKTGGSTYIVSIPKDWARGKLKEGDYVFIQPKQNSLEISLSEPEKSDKRVTLEYDSDQDRLIRKAVSYYLAGYDEKRIRFIDSKRDRENLEKKIRSRFTGIGITPTDDDTIELKNMLNIEQLPTKQVFRRCKSITETAFDDILDEEFDRVPSREDEIDRLHLLGVRQLNTAVKNPNARERLKLDSELACMEYRMVFKSIERVSDHLEALSEELEYIDEPTREVIQKLFKSYQLATEALLKTDTEKAEEAFKLSRNTEKHVETLDDHPQRVLNSFGRISALNRDIAEAAINMAATQDNDGYRTNQLKN